MGFETSNAQQATPNWAGNYTMGVQIHQEDNDKEQKKLTLEQGLAQNSIFCAYNQ